MPKLYDTLYLQGNSSNLRRKLLREGMILHDLSKMNA